MILVTRLFVARTRPLPNTGEITEDWDIDRWENDGGKCLSEIYEYNHDKKSNSCVM